VSEEQISSDSEQGSCQEAGFTWGPFGHPDNDVGQNYSRPGDCCWNCYGCTRIVTDPTQASSNCTFNGQTVNSGASVTAYLSNNVPHDQTCQSETRTCTNGTLSGSYTYPACTISFSLGATVQ
jgi:hypothetical protein